MMKFLKSHAFTTAALIVCGIGLWVVFSLISNECPKFAQNAPTVKRPVWQVVNMFWIATGIYLLAFFAAGGLWRRQKIDSLSFSHLTQLAIVFCFGLIFRAIMTPTDPIQEIDLYRYVWDGAVFSSPNDLDSYFHGPDKIKYALNEPEFAAANPELQPYVDLVDERPGLRGILDVLHYGQYTSPYPPVSHFFFGASLQLVEKDADTFEYIKAMKVVLVVFDVLTAILIAMLLYHVGLNPVLMLAYFWCPLVLKEIANGGHLDSIATFFCLLAVYFLTRAVWHCSGKWGQSTSEDGKPPVESALPAGSLLFVCLSVVSLAAGVASKVFPVVLLPLGAVVLLRTGLKSIIAISLFVICCYFFSYPMLKHLEIGRKLNLVSSEEVELVKDADLSGIEAFSHYWEMNDFLFMLAVENVKPDGQNQTPANTPWFRFTDNETRQKITDQVKERFSKKETPDEQQLDRKVFRYSTNHYSFLGVRYLTMAIFSVIVLYTCVTVLLKKDAIAWLEMAFLTLAWFWLLSPTQNPWYLTWAIPLLVFARGTTWFFLSGCALTYYLRFLFTHHYEGIDVMASWKATYGDYWYYDLLFPYSDQFTYQGTLFYDFYVPFLEFGPFLIALFVCWVARSVYGWVRKAPQTSSKIVDG